VPNEVLTCDELYVTNAFDLWMFSPYCATAARELARIVEPEFDAEEERPVFIHRRSGPRLLENFDSLAGELDQRGFITLDVETMSIRQTIAKLRAAPLVVGEHGDELAALLFCRPGTPVLELFNPACLQPIFWSMASCMDLRYGFLVGNHVSDAGFPEPSWNSDYEVPPEALRSALDAVGSPQ
jgi:capsular polysaccharide biosynthesis protein